jgi:group II intron reverse transcriptase/maturase
MHEPEKSDECVLPKKHANKGRAEARSAERVEGRHSTKGNSSTGTKDRTQSRVTLQSNLRRVREAADRYRGQQLTSLWHHCYNVDHLRAVFFDMKKSAAAGVDGVTWSSYAENLEDNLQDLSARLARGAYRAKPVRRTYIPKADGRLRPLGIPTLEDKLVQGLTRTVLEQVYEQEFAGFSYGCRPGRGPHGALDALATAIQRHKVSWVLDADIRGFFDAIDHDCLLRLVEHRIGDQRVLRHLKKWLNAGVLEDGKKHRAASGTPQGGSISPLLANVYLHYAFDLWVTTWRKEEARGDVYAVRYLDDFVVGFQYADDARRFQEALIERLATFHLELHPDKTRLIEFGRFADESRRRRGGGKPETFHFLGFTHYCTKTRQGKFRVGRRTQRKRTQAKLKDLKEQLRKRMHMPIAEVGAWLARILRGHYQYYGVPGNSAAMAQYRDRISRLWYTVLRRRSHKGRLRWDQMSQQLRRWLPTPRITHPWPDARFDVTTRGRSPVR